MNGGSLQKDHVRDHELHHRVIDFEREVAQCRVGAASRIPEIGKSGLRQCQLDFRSELLSVLFVGGYGTNCHLSLRRLFNPQCNLVALLHSPQVTAQNRTVEPDYTANGPAISVGVAPSLKGAHNNGLLCGVGAAHRGPRGNRGKLGYDFTPLRRALPLAWCIRSRWWWPDRKGTLKPPYPQTRSRKISQ